MKNNRARDFLNCLGNGKSIYEIESELSEQQEAEEMQSHLKELKVLMPQKILGLFRH